MKFLRLFDWKFILSLALLMLVSHLVINGIAISNDNKAKSNRIDVLISEIQKQQESAERERQAASAERAALLAGQHNLSKKYDSTVFRQNALLIYLRRHGIKVPDRFLFDSNKSSTSSGTSASRTTSGNRATKRKTRSIDRSPTVDLPGNSEKSKGKKKIK